MQKVNLSAMAQALLKAGLPGKVPEAAHVDRQPVPLVRKAPLPAWERPAAAVVITSNAKAAKDLVRACAGCGEDFKAIPLGDSLPTLCSDCLADKGNRRLAP
jgi:hypothetical protein